MRVYLASPQGQLQAHAVNGKAVLVSYANYNKWMDRYLPSYDHILVDPGAFSELTGKKAIDPVAYAEWAAALPGIDAWAGVDDIRGDWRRSLKNYTHGGFPTFHDSDPPELLDDLIPLARERGDWMGVGLLPPRRGKGSWVSETLGRIPNDIHVHGWALRAYTHLRRLDSVDSTNWWRDAMKLRRDFPWLTYGETLDLVVKRYDREHRLVEKGEPLALWSDC
jgi:hypothetical protein